MIKSAHGMVMMMVKPSWFQVSARSLLTPRKIQNTENACDIPTTIFADLYSQKFIWGYT
jgi:hypothetical protein